MVKQLHINLSLLIALDLCQPHYQNLLKKNRDKNRKSECKFKGSKNNKRSCRCSECKNSLNNDTDMFILLLKNVLIHINTWIVGKNLMKLHFQIKKAFYSKLYLENITDEGYKHAQKVFKYFEMKNLGEYHGLYIQGDTLLLADGFKNLYIYKNLYKNLYINKFKYL